MTLIHSTGDRSYGKGERWIYIVQAGGSGGPIKIGHSKNPERRRELLQHGNHLPLRIIATRKGGTQDEVMLFRRLSQHRIRGSWFTAEALKHLPYRWTWRGQEAA